MKVMVPVNPARGMDLNGDGRITIDELARSTLLIAAWLFGGLGSFSVLVILVFNLAPAPADLLVLALALATVSLAGSFALGVYRMLRYERLEKREKVAWHLEHERAKWEFDQAKGISKEAGETSLSQAQVDMAAQAILSRYYSGKEWGREAMVKDHLVTAELWNEANAVLKKRRIRKGRKRELEPETFADAWGIYCEAKLRQNRHKLAGNDWREAD